MLGTWQIAVISVATIGTLLIAILSIVAVLCTPKHRLDGLSYTALGLTLGLLIGLSASPVLAATLAAVFALAGQLAAMYLKQTTTFAGLFVAPTRSWLFPVASFAAVGILLGVTLRSNDLLNFTDKRIDGRLRLLGFSEDQVEVIMARLTNTLTIKDVIPPHVDSSKAGTFLLSSDTAVARGPNRSTSGPCTIIRYIASLHGNNDADILASLEEIYPTETAAARKQWQAQNPDKQPSPSQTIQILREMSQ